MKLLFLVTDDWFFWSHRLHLARAARDAGFDVAVATSRGSYEKRIEAEGFDFHPVSFARSVPGQVRNLPLVLELTRLYARLQPDLCHHVSFLPVLYGSLAARRAKVRSVVNAITGLGHAFISPRAIHPLRWAMERAYRHVLRGEHVRTIFQNADDQNLFVERGLVAAEQTAIVPGSGVDTERFRPSPEVAGPPVVLFASRMLWSKGAGVLVKAGEILRQRGVAHELRLVGRPHPSNPDSIAEAQLEEWDRSGSARWMGYQSDMPGVLAGAHVVCLPSHYREGVPLALIEGAAAGRPLVATDSPGCRDIVRHGQNGLLVPERDPMALAQALETLIGEADVRARMGQAGRALVEERFSKDVVNAGILRVYRELLDGAWPEDPRGGPVLTPLPRPLDTSATLR